MPPAGLCYNAHMDVPTDTSPDRWLFGPEGPGHRCGARTRGGTPCQKPALVGRTRCQLHGGRAAELRAPGAYRQIQPAAVTMAPGGRQRTDGPVG
ncbi:MAG: HGGxSTG domain-containing protein [Xanthobacteraceae bacterium]